MRKERPESLEISEEEKKRFSRGFALYSATNSLGSSLRRVFGVTNHVEYTPDRVYTMRPHKKIFNIAEQRSLD